MTELYPDELELLEKQIINGDAIDINTMNLQTDFEDDDFEAPDLPEPPSNEAVNITAAGYSELDPPIDCSYLCESESTEKDDSIIQLEAALDKQAPTIDADFSLDELFPASTARVVHKSSLRSQSDPIALSMMLIAATGGLLGSKVRVHTKGGDPLAGNLYVWLVGDTSSKKSKIAKKITNPLFGIKAKEHARIKEAISNIKKKDSNPEQKREEIESLKNNQRLQFFESLDISEQGLIKQLCKQAPLQGLHMHLDEGSDLFNGVDRYSGNRGSSGTAKTGLLRNLLLTGWVEPQRGSGAKADEERCIDFDEQTLTLTANIQQQFLPQILDIEEDSLGFAARHDVVLVTSSDETMIRESEEIDPASEFMLNRLIPFCQSIQIAQTYDTDATGIRIRYTLCKFSGEAQELYDKYVTQTKQEVAANNQQEIEPAFTAYLAKVGVRLGKLALIQHILEALEGAKRDTAGCDFDFDIVFSNANKRIQSPISKQAMQRAIRWCIVLCKQRQLVVDSTRSAPMKREAQLLLGEKQKKMSHILDKLKNRCLEYGPQLRSKFVANTKGTRNMGRAEVSDIIDTLIKRGCIKQDKEGKALVLVWLKPLREARCQSHPALLSKGCNLGVYIKYTSYYK